MIKQYKLSIVVVLIVGLLALVPNANATGYMDGANWAGIDSIKNQAGNSFILNSTFLCGANTTCTYHANGSVSISAVGGSVTGMSNPATADLNMSRRNITNVYEIIQNGTTVNVKAYGATGNGVTDDTQAINDAYNATPGNGILYFPNGDYNISSTLDIKKNINIIGDSKLSTRIYQSQDKTLISINASGTFGINGRFSMKDITLISSATSVGTSLLKLTNANHLFFRDINLRGSYYGIYLNGALGNLFENVEGSLTVPAIGTPSSNQYWVYADYYNGYAPNANIFINPILQSGVYGMYYSSNGGEGNFIIDGGAIEANSADGLTILNTNVPSTITGTHFESNGGWDIRVNSSNHISFVNDFAMSTNSVSVESDSQYTTFVGGGYDLMVLGASSSRNALLNTRTGIATAAPLQDNAPDTLITSGNNIGDIVANAITADSISITDGIPSDNISFWNQTVSDIGLVLHLKLDENNSMVSTNNTIYDSSRWSNDGVWSGNTVPNWTVGKVGGGMSFDNINDVITVPDDNSLDVTNNFTASAWFKLSVVGDEHPGIFGKGSDFDGVNSGYSVRIDGDSGWKLKFATTNGTTYTSTFRSFTPDNLWHQVIVSYANPITKIYLDGILGGTGSQANMTANPYNFFIGKTDYGYKPWANGSIDDVRLYNRTLTDNEIKSLYYSNSLNEESSFVQTDNFRIINNTGYNIFSLSDTGKIWNGTAWDWFLMPSKVFGTGVVNNNNGSITITDAGSKTSLPFTIENGTNIIGSDYSNFFTTGFAGTLTKLISHSTQSGSINVSFWNASNSNSYIGSVAIAAGTDASTVLSYPFADETRIMFNITGAVTDIKQVGLTIKATKS